MKAVDAPLFLLQNMKSIPYCFVYFLSKKGCQVKRFNFFSPSSFEQFRPFKVLVCVKNHKNMCNSKVHLLAFGALSQELELSQVSSFDLSMGLL